MQIERIAAMSHTVKIRFEDVDFCIDESWLDGDTIKPKFQGHVVERKEKALWWNQLKNRPSNGGF